MAFLLDALAAILDNGAAKKKEAAQAALTAKSLATQKAGFDTRLAQSNTSDANILDTLRKEHGDSSKLASDTFNTDLGLSKDNFDQQHTTASKAFSDQIDQLGGLMTAQRAARLKQQDASLAERDRQTGFQSSADALAKALPGKIGADAQSAGMTAALARREALLGKTTTPAPSPDGLGFGGNDDPLVAAAYKAQAERGSAQGREQNSAAAKLAAYADAFSGANRDMGTFADKLGGLTTQAELSRSALPDELATGNLDKSQAQARYDFASQLTGNVASQKEAATGARASGMTGATDAYGAGIGGANNNYYGTKLSGLNDFITALNTNSDNAENRSVALNNGQAAAMTASDPMATLLKWGSKLADDAGAAMMGRPSSTPAPSDIVNRPYVPVQPTRALPSDFSNAAPSFPGFH
jgi:hypothetical protein